MGAILQPRPPPVGPQRRTGPGANAIGATGTFDSVREAKASLFTLSSSFVACCHSDSSWAARSASPTALAAANAFTISHLFRWSALIVARAALAAAAGSGGAATWYWARSPSVNDGTEGRPGVRRSPAAAALALAAR